MYFHDITFEKQLMNDLSDYPVKWIQAEHKLGRIKISLDIDFDEEEKLILYIVHKMLVMGADYQHKSTKRFDKISGFTEPYTEMIFKEMITI